MSHLYVKADKLMIRERWLLNHMPPSDELDHIFRTQCNIYNFLSTLSDKSRLATNVKHVQVVGKDKLKESLTSDICVRAPPADLMMGVSITT